MLLFKRHGDVIDPARGTPSSCGLDLTIPEEVLLPPLSTYCVDHKVSFCFPPGYYGQIFLRSSAAALDISVKAGVIDPDYTGTVRVRETYMLKTSTNLQHPQIRRSSAVTIATSSPSAS